jgi:hypothetical protein
MIEFACEHCGRSMKVNDAAAGKRGKCKDCGKVVTIPQQVAAASPPPIVATPRAQQPVAKPAEEKVLYQRHPSMFRNRPILFIVFVLLIAAYFVGLLLLLIWWIRDLGITLTVTDKRTTLRYGILSKSITEIWHRDVRNVLVSQSFFQRIFGVGSIGVSSAGGPGLEIQVAGMANPYRVKQIIDAGR